MMHLELSIDESRAKLLRAIGDTDDITFIRGHGNIGDDLIYAGARQLLSSIDYREESVLGIDRLSGQTAVLAGSGAWCGTYHAMPEYLVKIISRFERVIVFPSSFDVSAEGVHKVLSQTQALVFARELVSFEHIRNLCSAAFANDTALYFDYRPYMRKGTGVLTAFRTDQEAARPDLPDGNNDISMTCATLDEWLWTIARHDTVRTDRAHVTIAAALLGKRVEYGSSNYHKVPAIVDFSLRGFPVYRLEAARDRATIPQAGPAALGLPRGERQRREDARRQHVAWLDMLRQAREEIDSMVPPGQTFVFVDQAEFGRGAVAADRHALPFMEKGGQYWGPPPDDFTAVRELERLRQFGAMMIIFAWPAFWWLDHYSEFREYLTARYRRIWSGERLIAFDLRLC